MKNYWAAVLILEREMLNTDEPLNNSNVVDLYCNDERCDKTRRGEKHPTHFSESLHTLTVELKSCPRHITVNYKTGTFYL